MDPNTPQNVQVTGNESQDVENLIKENVRQVFQEFQSKLPQGTTPAPTSTPIEITLDGTKYTFENADKLAEGLKAYRENVYNAALEEAKKNTVKAPVTAPPPGQPNKPVFDEAKFVDMFTKNPVEAFNYVDEIRYGFPNAHQVLTQGLLMVEQQRRIIEANAFRDAAEDFPNGDPKAAEALANIVTANNLPWTRDNLAMAWNHAKNNGWIKPVVNETPVAPQPTMNANVLQMDRNPDGTFRGKAGIPTAPRGNSFDPSPELDKFRGLPLEEMEKVLKRSGMLH